MIYRVIERTTNLYRNQFTYWDNKVLYCGINKTQARVNYLSSKPNDYNNGFGETASETVIEEFESYSKDVRSEQVIFTNKNEIDEQAVKKTIAEIKEFTCSETVAISYVRLSKKDNDLNVEIKVGDDWISVIKDEYEKDFIHIVTVANLSEINKKFRM
jgi:GTPase involved in cell partitioning and DNA repair